MKTEILRTYKFYDKQGRRLSVFALSNGLHLDVYTITCSKHDQFSKKYSRSQFEDYLKGKEVDIHPVTETVPVIDEKPFYTLLKFCKANYFKKVKIIEAVEKEILVKQNIKSYDNI